MALILADRYLPEAIANVTHSTIYLAQQVTAHYLSTGSLDKSWLESTIFEDGLGLTDATEEEVTKVDGEKGNAIRLERVLVRWSTPVSDFKLQRLNALFLLPP